MRKIMSVFFVWCIFYSSNAQQVTPKKDMGQRRHQIVCSAYSPDGNHIITGGFDNKIIIWCAQTGNAIRELKGLRRFPLSIRFSPNGNYVIAGGKDSRITIWDFASGREMQKLRGHRGDISSISISPDSKFIASAGHDRTIRLWELATGNNLHTLTGHRGEVMAVDFSADGNTLISGSADGTVRLWDSRSGNQLKTINAHDGWVRNVAYSPTGNFIASGGHDNAIKIWNTRTMELHNSILAHSGWVETLSFSPDGRYLVSGGHDNYLVMIEVSSGRIVFHSEKQSHYVLSVEFSPNGNEFVSSSLNSDRLMVWNTLALNINPRPSAPLTQEPIARQKQKPVIQWISNNNSEVSNLAFRASYQVRSEYPAEDIVLYLNDERYVSSGELKVVPSTPFEQVVYLNEGVNKIMVEIFYSNGVVSTEELKVTYKPQETIPVLQAEIEPSQVTTPIADYKPNDGAILEDPVAEEATSLITPQEPIAVAPESIQRSPLFDIPFQNPTNPYRFALIIGNEDYSCYQVGLHTESNVDYAINDAKAFREYAVKVMGVPRDNILFLTNARAIEMDNEIQKLRNIIRALEGKADVIVYFAGHGFPDEQTREPYIMPVDVSGTNLRFAIKINDFYQALTEYPSERVTVFMDACFSGGARNVGLVSARGVRVRPQEHLLKGNLVVFTASSGNQSAHPYREKGHGIFTWFLLDKLRETRGEISYRELSEYIRETVGVRSAMINNTEQTPQTNVSVDIESIWTSWTIK